MIFDEREIAFATNLQKTFPSGSQEYSYAMLEKTTLGGFSKADLANTLWTKVIEHSPISAVMPGSTEVGDVSQITPTAQLTTSCWPLGTPPHSWQITASSGSSIGFKGMLFASKALALTALDLLTKPDLLQAAQTEFAASTERRKYVSPLPDGTVPH